MNDKNEVDKLVSQVNIFLNNSNDKFVMCNTRVGNATMLTNFIFNSYNKQVYANAAMFKTSVC